MKIVWLMLGAAATVLAQVNGPSLGWTPDGSHVRPMYGLAGAAALGDPVDVGRDLSLIAAAPGFVVATAADNGQALLIANGVANPIRGVNAGAARIAISPQGSAAALWFANGHFQIVSGLPGAAAVRDVDASFLDGAPIAMAASDDGLSLAGAWASGGWIFGSSGVAALPVNERIEAISFFAGQSGVVAATSERVVSISGGAVSTLYDWSHDWFREAGRRRPVSPFASSAAVGIATSFDNRSVVMANHAGDLLAMDVAAGTSAIFRCECTPEGVFGLGGSAFRLTSPTSGAVKVFDASTDLVSVVPPMLVPSTSASTRSAVSSSATLPALPAVTFGGIPTATGYKQQPPMTISIAAAYPVTITGTATLTFQSAGGGDDQMIQFVSGGRAASFTIPAGGTQASFGSSSTLPFSTGTVAGTITITLDLVASGTDITPSPAPALTYTTNPTVPSVSLVSLNQTPGGVTVVVTGFSSTREVVSGTFTFAPATGSTISTPTLTVQLSSAFSTWYSNTASNAYGSQFTLTVPFPVSSGQAGSIVAVTVTLTNSKGGSTPVSQ